MNELTTTFRIESPPAWLEIGYDAENNWRTITINCEYWFNIDANGTVVLMYKPVCSKPAYPLEVERSGNNIVWTPESAELVAGVGTMQAFFEADGTTIGASKKIPCEVDGSLLGSASGGTPPWAIDMIEQIKELTGHYPYIADGKLYVWDSINEEWVEFASEGGGGAVDSVNGKTGVVVLDAEDVGALPDDTVIPSQIGQLSDNVGLVHYNSQTLTDAQKAQARTNIGAASMSDIPSLAAYRTASAQDAIDAAQDSAIAAKYTKPSVGIPASDLASDVQTSLGKADTALQSAPVTSVNNKTGAVTLTASDVGALPSSTSIPTKVSDLTNDSGFQTAPFEIPITQSGSTYTTTATAADILAHIDNCVLVENGVATIRQTAYAVQGSNAQIIFSNTDSAYGFIHNVTLMVVVNNGTVTIVHFEAEDELPTVTASDNGKFLRVVSGAWAAQDVPSAESNSFGGGA